MRALCFVMIWLGPALFAQAEIKGSLVDGTRNVPGQADVVQLVRIAQTMEVLAAFQNIKGDFTFKADVKAGESLLVQAIKGRTIYTQAVQDFATPVALTVFDNSEAVEILAHLGTLAIYAVGDTVEIGAFYNLDNQSNPPMTLDKQPYTFSFPVSPGYSNLEASTRRGQTPLRQQLSVSEGMASISYPLRPGRTQLMIRAIYPYDPINGSKIPLRMLPDPKSMNVLVIPNTVELKAVGADFVSKDEQQNVNLYEWTPGEAIDELILELKGASADPSEREEQSQAQNPHPNGQGPKVEYKSKPNAMDEYRWHIAGGSFILLLSLALWAAKRA